MRYHKKIGTNRFSCIGVDTKRNHKCIHTCYRQRRYKNICCTNTLKRNNSLNTTNFCPLRESRDTWRQTNRRLNCIIYVRILWNINFMRMRRRKIDEYRKGCNIRMICLEINRIFYDPSWILQLSEFVWTLRSSVWVVLYNSSITLVVLYIYNLVLYSSSITLVVLYNSSITLVVLYIYNLVLYSLFITLVVLYNFIYVVLYIYNLSSSIHL